MTEKLSKREFVDEYPYLVYTDKEDTAYNGSGGSGSIPIASADTLGGVKVGEGLSITEEGVLSANGGSGLDFGDMVGINVYYYDSDEGNWVPVSGYWREDVYSGAPASATQPNNGEGHISGCLVYSNFQAAEKSTVYLAIQNYNQVDHVKISSESGQSIEYLSEYANNILYISFVVPEIDSQYKNVHIGVSD